LPGTSSVGVSLGGALLVVCDGVLGVCDGVSLGGVLLGVSDTGGSLVVGVSEGVSLGDSLAEGVCEGRTAAPCLVSRSNLLTSSITLKVYVAQIWAGKPPPLTRGTPSAPYSGTCLPFCFTSSPNRPTAVASSGV